MFPKFGVGYELKATPNYGVIIKVKTSELFTNLKTITFNELVGQADYIVAHNISFDEKILGAELLRKGIRSDFGKKRKLCTMQASTNYCKLPGPYGYKWPKLSELHIKLFGENFDEAHDASVDINATEKCFWELRKIGLI